MELAFHRLISRDLQQALNYYDSEGGSLLGDRFFSAVEECVEKIREHPKGHHFSDGGYRRAQLKTFPYHFLYEVDEQRIWIAVLRHDRRHPSYGLRRKRES